MAVSDAVRRSGSLLFRVLAVGGLATAAWLVCAGSAAAGGDHTDEVARTLDAVNATLGGQRSATAGLLADVLPPRATPVAALAFDPFAFEVGAHPIERPPLVDGPLEVPYPQGGYPTDDGYPYPDEDRFSDPDCDDGYGRSGYSHSGSASNTMPEPLYEAKVAAKAAARAAASAQAEPTFAPAHAGVIAPARADGASLAPAAPVSPSSQIASTAEVVWEVPEPSTPAPSPKQAPAPSAPTASSSSSADNGGGHRGGVIASFTGQSDPKPLTAWSVERRDDGRSPGSVPGLPSTSPD